MMKLTLCAVLATACFALVSSKMCTPDQWEGYEVSVGGYATKQKDGTMKEISSFHYDYRNRRSALFMDDVVGDYEIKFQIVIHGKGDESLVYIVDTKKGSCSIKKLDHPFRQICIPEEAKCGKEYYLGLSGGFKVMSCQVGRHGRFVDLTVEKKGDNVVVPVEEIVTGTLNKVDFVQSNSFVDITPGIKNETVFDIPDPCVSETGLDSSVKEMLTREHLTLAL